VLRRNGLDAKPSGASGPVIISPARDSPDRLLPVILPITRLLGGVDWMLDREANPLLPPFLHFLVTPIRDRGNTRSELAPASGEHVLGAVNRFPGFPRVVTTP
jgi:hypothetical protein